VNAPQLQARSGGGIIPSARKAAAILMPKQHILLLSHMRSYTSLFGHILGSNPEICGYYEMHIGYHSWKSLIRQKLLYFRHEDPKPGFRYMFDKVLHNDHDVSPAILNHRQTRAIFCLRHPRDAIPSILKLYRELDPTHEFNSQSFATEYYVRRLSMLERMSDALDREFFYLDAESLKSDTQECLLRLSDWLQLGSGLASSYELQRNTSKKRYGDSSGRLQVGQVLRESSDYADFPYDGALLQRAVTAYERARNHLLSSTERRCVMQPADSPGKDR